MMYQIFCIGLSFLPFLLVLPVLRLSLVFSREKLRARTTIFHELAIVLFWLYLVVVLHITLDTGRVLRFDFQPGFRQNLIPGAGIVSVIENGTPSFARLNIYGNILMFVPLGFFLPLLWRRFDSTSVAAFGALMSLTIEVLQWYTGRSADVDDVLLNTLGALVGYLLYMAARFIIPSLISAFRLKKKHHVPA